MRDAISGNYGQQENDLATRSEPDMQNTKNLPQSNMLDNDGKQREGSPNPSTLNAKPLTRRLHPSRITDDNTPKALLAIVVEGIEGFGTLLAPGGNS